MVVTIIRILQPIRRQTTITTSHAAETNNNNDITCSRWNCMKPLQQICKGSTWNRYNMPSGKVSLPSRPTQPIFQVYHLKDRADLWLEFPSFRAHPIQTDLQTELQIISLTVFCSTSFFTNPLSLRVSTYGAITSSSLMWPITRSSFWWS